MKRLPVTMVVFFFTLSAYGFNMEVSPSALTLGKHIAGPERDVQRLAGHVVVVEFWGYSCGPCIASIPKLNALHTEFDEQGLIIIGLQCWTTSDDTVRSVAKKHGIAYTVVNGGNLPGTDDITGVPHVLLFDHTGKCIYRGHPADRNFEEELRKAMAAAPPPLFSTKDFKKLAGLVSSLKKGASPASVIKFAESSASASDAATAAEARIIIERLTEDGRKRIEDAQALKADKPYSCYQALNSIAEGYEGLDVGKEADRLLAEFKKDKEFMKEVKAGEMLDSLRKLAKNLKPIDSLNGPDWKSSAFQKQNAATLQQMVSIAASMKSQYPKSQYTAEALALLEKYGVKTK